MKVSKVSSTAEPDSVQVLTPAALKDNTCEVVETQDGGMIVSFKISEDYAKRIRMRAYRVPVAKYLWDDVLHRALDGALF